MADKLIASISKNKTEEIRVSLTKFREYDLASIRVWFQADDGEMRPGKSGLAVRLEKVSAVIEALQQLEAEARRLGLVEVSP